MLTAITRRSSRLLAGSLWTGCAAAVAAGAMTDGGFSRVTAQEACCYQPAYRLQCATVMEPEKQITMRPVWESIPEVREVTETRMVRKLRTEEREYTVAKPVTETAYREEEYTVMRPVLETSYEQRSRDVTRMVTETSEREEQYTTYRPVVETTIHQRQYQVQRPVTETAYQTQAYTTLRPVTTYQNQVVDAGGYVPQQVVVPGTVGYGLQWVPRAYQTTGPLGILAVNRGGLFWTPQVTPPTVQTQMAYRPNLINQQVAQTQYVPETVQQQVPVQRTRIETETVTENVPVQVTKMEPIVETRRVPVTVQRPVTETISEQVPVQKYKYVRETKTRRVPVVSHRIEYETRKEPVQVEYYEPETVTRQYTVTRQVQRMVPVETTVMVQRPVLQGVPLSYYDGFGAAITSGYSSLRLPVVEYPSTVGSSVLESSKPAVDPEDENEDDADDQKPKTVLDNIKNSSSANSGSAEPGSSEASPSDGGSGEADPDDLKGIEAPALLGPESGSDAETSGESST
jgi:hypothetical protein